MFENLLTNTNNFSSRDRRLFLLLQNLTEQNRQIQFYSSFILLFILIELTNSFIAVLCILLIDSVRFGLIVIYEQCIRWFVFISVIEMNRRNLLLFNHIDRYFYRKFSTIQLINSRHHNNNNNWIARYSKYNQIEIFRQYYQLSLFNWLDINISLLIEIFFFSLGCVMIIALTS